MAEAASVAPALAPDELKRRVAEQVPATKEGVFGYDIKWGMLDAAPPELSAKISDWVSKKVRAAGFCLCSSVLFSRSGS